MKVILLIMICLAFSVSSAAQKKIQLKDSQNGIDTSYFAGNRHNIWLHLSGFSSIITVNSIKLKWADYTDTIKSRHYIYSLKKLLEQKNENGKDPSKLLRSDTSVKLMFELPEIPGVYEFRVDSISDSVKGSWPYDRHADSICGRYKLFINAGLDSNEKNIQAKLTGRGLIIDNSFDSDLQHWLQVDSFIKMVKIDSVNKNFRDQNKIYNDTSKHCSDAGFLRYAVIISNQSSQDTAFFPKYSSLSIVIDPLNVILTPPTLAFLEKSKLEIRSMLNLLFDSAKHIVDTTVLSPANLIRICNYYDSVIKEYPLKSIYISAGFLNASLETISALNVLNLTDSCSFNYLYIRKSHMMNQLILYGKVRIEKDNIKHQPVDNFRTNQIKIADKNEPFKPIIPDVADKNNPNWKKNTNLKDDAFETLNVETLGLVGKLPDLNNIVEVSGIAVKDDQFYLVEERCGKIWCINAETMTENSVIQINGLKDQVEFEGLAFYKNYLLITNEKSGTPNRVYYQDLSDSSRSYRKVSFMTGEDKVAEDTGNYGIEGIAVNEINEQQGICYLLKEKYDTDSSGINLFDIRINENSVPELTYKKMKIIIKHNPGYRYSDIYFYHAKNCLYALRTQEGNYYVDKIYLEEVFKMTGHEKKYLDKNGDTVYCVSSSVKSAALDYRNLSLENGETPNLEGISVYKDHIYLINDNRSKEEKDYRCSSKVKAIKPTSLFRIKIF